MGTLQFQKLRVHLADGRTLETETKNPDYIRWELTAARERWPIMEVHGDDARVPAPMLMNTFMAWAALTREGTYAGKWAEFSESDCLAVEAVEAVAVDPTQPEPVSGS